MPEGLLCQPIDRALGVVEALLQRARLREHRLEPLGQLAGGGAAAALVRTGGDPCADGACAPFAAEPAGGVASRALAWLRACSWGALFWLAVGACCGVPWVGYCVLFAYHFARFSAKPRAPAADRSKSLSVASTLEAIFT